MYLAATGAFAPLALNKSSFYDNMMSTNTNKNNREILCATFPAITLGCYWVQMTFRKKVTRDYLIKFLAMQINYFVSLCIFDIIESADSLDGKQN